MMDFLDPKKSRARTIRLYIGYFLIAIALFLAAVVLFYLASGFGVKQGKVIQNGLVFVSSSPSGADIYLNGSKQNDVSNARLILQSGTYTMRLSREGYRDWQRAVTVEGGSVDRFDYPLLIPNDLTAATAGEYAAAPPLATQSPDRRWLLVQQPGQTANFDVYDIRDPEQVAATKTSISLPANLLDLPQSGAVTLQLAEWSRNNTHVLLRHVVGGQSEYILLSHDNPAESVNLTRQLQLKATEEVTLQDKKFDRFFIHDTETQTLTTASLGNTARTPLLTGVIDYKTYGNDVVLYATATDASAGKTAIKLYQDEQSHTIRQITQTDNYLLDLSTYDGDWYAVLGSPAEDHVYIYKDVAERLRQDADRPLVPIDILKLQDPNYVEFSANSQFVMAENGQDIATFDAENERSYTYRLDRPIDTPQTHVTWMDGFRLRFVSGGNVTIVDYDGTNAQTLTAGSAAYLPFFDTAYQTHYAVTPLGGENPDGRMLLTATSLRTERDR
jgi:hypothetical protein